MTPKSSRLFWEKREKRSMVDAKMEAERLLSKLQGDNSIAARSLCEHRLSAALREFGPCRATWFEGRPFVTVFHRAISRVAAAVGIAPSAVTAPSARGAVGYSRRLA